jgi:protein-S-isoprenylcysteine O-methyltransferase Ste14
MADPTPNVDSYGRRTVVQHFFIPLAIAVLLFLGAGTLDWGAAWVFCILNLLGWAGLNLALIRWNPEILNERGRTARRGNDVRRWDMAILVLYTLMLLAQPLIAGLDYRNGWSAPGSPVIMLLGNVLNLFGVAMIAWSMAANRFFAPVVQIQEARGHQVVASGPYAYVRHPGYVGVILGFIGLALAVGSWVALIPGIVGVILYVVCTALEDRTLQAELSGYAEYAQHTRYRLLPGVW